jgi:hypothetical protein
MSEEAGIQEETMVEINPFESPIQREASEQLAFIESMILEGRKTTSYWGWTFVLWGVAYLIATVLGSDLVTPRIAIWAWPVMMTIAGVTTGLSMYWRNQNNPQTAKSQAIGSIWVGIGVGLTLFAFPTIIGHHFGDGHAFTGGIEVLLGAANVASGRILRWRLQTAVGLIWWAAAVLTEVTQSGLYVLIAFLTATVLCNICFGIYLMVLESRDKARLRAGQVAHA